MTLGDIIKDYRKTHHLSMDAFSEKSGISKAYISLLEKTNIRKPENLLHHPFSASAKPLMAWGWILILFLA